MVKCILEQSKFEHVRKKMSCWFLKRKISEGEEELNISIEYG